MGRASNRKWNTRAANIATLRQGKKVRGRQFKPSTADVTLADQLEQRLAGPKLQRAQARHGR